jgi:protein-S-isoprenylcysteine O-methyltransferase Ste14
MPGIIFKMAYFAAIIVEMFIRAPIEKVRRQNKIVADQVSRQERLLLILLLVGMGLLPLLYAVTPWLNFANYQLPAWAGWLGLVFLTGALLVFWKAHQDLGRNWSPSLQIREGHELITNGLYRYIRHPMYASQMLWIIAQPLLLQNWIAGVLGALVFLPLYFTRVNTEEQMMLQEFGEPYRAYLARTGRVLPRLGSATPNEAR